ncbi:MAG: sugar transferase [Thermoflexaceae bacterium]|nr:sugar transferase [Thermoflexaceae bacterium]
MTTTPNTAIQTTNSAAEPWSLSAEGTLQDLLAEHLVPMPLWKRAIDIMGALAGIIITLPLLLAIGIAVALESPGGPLFRQVRIGKNGKAFNCYKFRTMVKDADAMKASLMDQNEANGHIFKMKNDPRRTRLGVFLRKSSLDELPQLWNVLKGDMSLVGPRPPVPGEVALYTPAHLRRLTVVPGITGLWQVTLRGHHDFADMVLLDTQYAENLSFALDVKILFRTVTTVLTGSGSC